MKAPSNAVCHESVSCTDTAYGCDPRVKRFKEAEKAEKLARKKAKDEATRREILEREKVN